MDKLVFVESESIIEVPFTTSEVIAEHAKVKHHAVQVLISNYESDLKEFGRLSFEMRPLQTNGGLQNIKVYHLNEEQATLLITYMKNTLPVRRFKKALVKQFYIMQKELSSREVTRRIGKEAREALTNAIQALPDSPHKAMKYKHYTDLVYVIVFGKNSKQLREEYGIDKDSVLRNMFSANEMDKVLKLENQVGVLLQLGFDYKQIKEVISKARLTA